MNDIALANQWDPNSGAALPAHLAALSDELGSNIADRLGVPSLSYEGKTWTIVKDGNKTKLQAKNGDGDMVPVPVMRTVILNYNPERGRAYYPGEYNPAASAGPDCWSPDGKAPDDSVKNKQNPVCNGCPMSIKGSKVRDGKESVACSSHRMIAVAPAMDLTMDPLRLKIAVTSDYDKDVVEHGWFAFRQYVDYLKSRGVAHTALVVTKIKFDPNPAYPKLLFAIDRTLTPDEVGTIKDALKNPKVAELLAEKWTAAGANGTQKDEKDIMPHGLEGAYADGWIAHPDSAGWSYKGDVVIENDKLAAQYPKPEPVAPTPPAIPATPPAIPSAGAVPHNAQAAALADGWAVHPENALYMFKGTEVLEVAAVEAKYPAPVAAPAVPAAPAIPAAPAVPAAPVVPQKSPRELAEADGWAIHPENAAYMFKGAEVLEIAAVEAKYPGNAGAGTTGSATPPAGSAPTAATTASPSSAEVPADVQGLLDKWTA